MRDPQPKRRRRNRGEEGRACACDYCCFPLEVAEPDEYGFDRFFAVVQRDHAGHRPLKPYPRSSLVCALTPANLFGFAQIRSGCVNPEGGHVEWSWFRRDFEDFLSRYGLDHAYRQGGMYHALREIGLTRMQAEAFMLHAGMGLTQPQVASRLGKTQGAVSLRLKGARQRIERWWTKQNLIILDLPTAIDEGHLFVPEAI